MADEKKGKKWLPKDKKEAAGKKDDGKKPRSANDVRGKLYGGKK